MKCDIILVVWNGLQVTRNCIDSLIAHTRYSYRIIAIDNGSSRDTQQYLQDLEKRKDIEVLLIRNEQNLGFVKAANQGLRASSSPYICLLNNDTLVTDDWLKEVVAIAENNPEIGILNPSSNHLGQYLIKNDTVDSYAKRLKELKGQWQEMSGCIGFCMLMKRAVFNKVGFLDEIFGVIYFEEIDFCYRAQRLGYRFARAKASYVYHQKSATVSKNLKQEQIFRKNQQICFRRWGRPLNIAYLAGNHLKIKQDKINKICLEAVRNNHKIFFFLKKSSRKSCRIPDQYNFKKYFWLDDFFYKLVCIYKILKRKRKKKIDIIFAEDRLLSNILKKLKFYHQADVLFEPGLEQARQLWEGRSKKCVNSSFSV